VKGIRRADFGPFDETTLSFFCILESNTKGIEEASMTGNNRLMRAGILMLWCAVLAGCGGDRGERGSSEQGAEKPDDIPLNVNLIDNPSFERWENNKPVGWQLEVFEGEGTIPPMFGKSTEHKKSGRYAYYIRGLGNTEVWYVLVQRHRVYPGYGIAFSAEIMSSGLKRTRGQGDMANLYVRFYDAEGNRISDRHRVDGESRHRWGDTEWFRDGRKLIVPDNAHFVELGLINLKTGYIYFDDVELILRAPPEWEETETEYITFLNLKGYPFPEGAIEREAARVEGYARRLHLKPGRRIKYYYYHSEDNFKKVVGKRKYRQRALWDEKELHTIDPEEDNQVIHLLLIDFGKPPTGLARGVVFALRHSMLGEDLHLVAKRLLIEKKMPALFRVIKDEDLMKIGTEVTIPAWSSFCDFLIERYGPEKFMTLYEKADKLEEAPALNFLFNEIYGENVDVIDREWRLFLMRYQPEGAGDTLQ
jgi:hypothetical protein